MHKNHLEETAYNYSLEVTKVCLSRTRNGDFILPKQLMRCASSISANIQEALGGYSKKDFCAKLSIAYKETRESKYWLRLMKDCDLLPEDTFNKFHSQADRISAILYCLIKNCKKNP